MEGELQAQPLFPTARLTPCGEETFGSATGNCVRRDPEARLPRSALHAAVSALALGRRWASLLQRQAAGRAAPLRAHSSRLAPGAPPAFHSWEVTAPALSFGVACLPPAT